jgi:hypothetical protein
MDEVWKPINSVLLIPVSHMLPSRRNMRLAVLITANSSFASDIRIAEYAHLGEPWVPDQMVLQVLPRQTWVLGCFELQYTYCQFDISHTRISSLRMRQETLNSVAVLREGTIPTTRPPLVGEVSANLCGYSVLRGRRNEFPRPLISVFLTGAATFSFK